MSDLISDPPKMTHTHECVLTSCHNTCACSCGVTKELNVAWVAPSVSSSAPPDPKATTIRHQSDPVASSAEPAPPTIGGKYRKKPVVIDAIQWTGRNPVELGMWRGQWPRTFPDFNIHPDTLEIDILELEDGHDRRVKHVASVGDYLIRGIQGEFYACKPDIFEASYERA